MQSFFGWGRKTPKAPRSQSPSCDDLPTYRSDESNNHSHTNTNSNPLRSRTQKRREATNSRTALSIFSSSSSSTLAPEAAVAAAARPYPPSSATEWPRQGSSTTETMSTTVHTPPSHYTHHNHLANGMDAPALDATSPAALRYSVYHKNAPDHTSTTAAGAGAGSGGGSTTTSHSASRANRPRHAMLHNHSNQFLWGGTYYPSSHNNKPRPRSLFGYTGGSPRRHFHQHSKHHWASYRHTLWYRVTWSSPLRRILTTVILVYAVVWKCSQIMMSTTSNNTTGSHYQARHRPKLELTVHEDVLAAWPPPPPPPPLSSRPVAPENSVPRYVYPLSLVDPHDRERAEANQAKRQRRHDILNRIVPEWLHRNDELLLQQQQKQQQQQQNYQEQHEEQKNSGEEDAEKPVERGKIVTDESELTAEQKGQHLVDGAEADAANDKPIINHDNPNVYETPEKALVQDLDEQQKVVAPQNLDNVEKNEAEIAENQQPQRQMEQLEQADHRQLRTLSNMHTFANRTNCSANLAFDDIHVSLVVQATLDRIWVLDETCRRWKDPIVAVVGVQVNETRQANTAALAGWKDKCPHLTLIEHTLNVKEHEERPEFYPVNHLRNIALDSVQTSHVLVVDVDFVPSDNLDHKIRTVLLDQQQRSTNGMLEDHFSNESMRRLYEQAVVVPAFERVAPTTVCGNGSSSSECMKNLLRHNSSFIPRSFDELKGCVDQNNCRVFQSDVNWEGHYSTGSEEWLKRKWYENADGGLVEADNAGADQRQHMKRITCFHSMRYEPYVVIRWCPTSAKLARDHPLPVAPYYDERFHGYGKNKIEHVQHLRLMGYQFFVLPEGFLVHNPHAESNAKKKWMSRSSNLHAEMDRLYPKFLQELLKMYEDRRNRVIMPCKN